MNGVFTFVDAMHLISKRKLWKERENYKRYEKMNNENISKVAEWRFRHENVYELLLTNLGFYLL